MISLEMATHIRLKMNFYINIHFFDEIFLALNPIFANLVIVLDYNDQQKKYKGEGNADALCIYINIIKENRRPIDPASKRYFVSIFHKPDVIGIFNNSLLLI